MTLYLRLKVRAVLLSPAVVGWAILFVLFWVAMWVYVFGGSLLAHRGEPWYPEAVRGYVATMYASLGMISLGSVAVELVSGYAAASTAVRYVTRFTRLTPSRLVAEDTLANMTVLAATVLTVIVSSILLSWQRFGVLATPENPLALAGLLLLLALFYHLLATVLSQAMLILGGGRGFQKLLTMLPLVVSFIPYALLFAETSNAAAYLFPPIGLQALVIGAAWGRVPPASRVVEWMAEYYTGHATASPVDPAAVLGSTALWLAVLAVLAVALSRRVRAVRPEELRTV